METTYQANIGDTLPAKIWNIFHFSDFLAFCGVFRVIPYLIYIPTSRYYFGGVNSHSIGKMNRKQRFKNNYFGHFSLSDAG